MASGLKQIIICPIDGYLILNDIGSPILICPHCFYKGFRDEFIKIID